MIRLLLSRGASLDARHNEGSNAEDYALYFASDRNAEARDLLADVRVAGGWDAYILFPRKRVLALRILCEQGRASTDDPLLRRLFPAGPPAGIAPPPIRDFFHAPGADKILQRALDWALAAQPAGATVDVGALAAAQAAALAAPPPKRRREEYRAQAGGRLPRGIFWHIFEYWRSDRDSPYSEERPPPRGPKKKG